MKKSLCSILTFVLIFALFLPFFSVSTRAETSDPNKAGTVLVTITAKVDPRFSAENHSITLNIINGGSGKTYKILLTKYGEYYTKVYLDPGKYFLTSYTTSEGLFSAYEINMPEFSASGLASNASLTIGDPDYKGEVVTGEEQIPGMIDEDLTNELQEQLGGNPIDWEAQHEKVNDKIEEDLKRREEKRNSESGSGNNGNENPDSSDTSEPPSTETGSDTDVGQSTGSESDTGSIDTGNSSEKGASENDEKDDTDGTDGKVGTVTIIFLVILAAAVGFVIYKRFKNNTLPEE